MERIKILSTDNSHEVSDGNEIIAVGTERELDLRLHSSELIDLQACINEEQDTAKGIYKFINGDVCTKHHRLKIRRTFQPFGRCTNVFIIPYNGKRKE